MASRKPPPIWRHPTVMPDGGPEPVRVNLATTHDSDPLTRWKYTPLTFDKGWGLLVFLPAKEAYGKYSLRIAASLTEDEIRTIAENTMMLLNIKDGL